MIAAMTRRAAILAIAVLLLLPAGVQAAGPRTWHLVALGDSIPFGGRYCGNCTPYPTLLARALSAQSGHPVSVRNFGVPGFRAGELVDLVRRDATVRSAIAVADIVTITIGHNDTPWNSRHDRCDGAAAWFGPYRDARWSTYAGACLERQAADETIALRQVLTYVRALRHGQSTLVELTTDWNQLIGEPGIGATARAASKRVLDRFAEVTCSVAKAWSARCADVYRAFNGPDGTRAAGTYLAADHDHASQRGHQKIATLLAASGFAPLTR
jgi:lysophospholipase L1-like esterase